MFGFLPIIIMGTDDILRADGGVGYTREKAVCFEMLPDDINIANPVARVVNV
jgi:hypothetical protein